MADYDSESSGAGDIETNVLLGYASKESTGDHFSQLGGRPVWIDGKTAPDGALVRCRVCNSYMSLLLQLHADLPDHFPGHERKLYLWSCRRKACRRKEGSVRGFRGTRRTKVDANAGAAAEQKAAQNDVAPKFPQTGLGEALFGMSKATTIGQANPFASPSASTSTSANPFATASSPVAKRPHQPEPSESLHQTFAEKARISSSPAEESSTSTSSRSLQPSEPWPSPSAFPIPYPAYYLDADKEYIDPEPQPAPPNIRVDHDEGSRGGNSQDLFESSMDQTFQKFADRLSQNPEQVLRYEHAGMPLLYAKSDAVGQLFGSSNERIQTPPAGRIPRCGNCGGERVFEMQLTPHAIAELEAEEEGLDGMDWGTILLAVCGRDCGVQQGEVGYVEEWVGVQWEELAKQK